MSDILRAMATSAAILFPIVVLIIIVGRAAVLRGEAAAHGDPHEASVQHAPHGVVADAKTATAALKAPAAAAVSENVSVLEILVFGTVLFVLAVVVLFGISIVNHM